MKVVSKGCAHKHDLVHVTCSHCNSNVTFWRGEKDTNLDYTGSNSDDGMAIFWAKWTCPVCGVYEKKHVKHIEPVYENIGTFEGVEKDRVLTVEEKAEMEEATSKEE